MENTTATCDHCDWGGASNRAAADHAKYTAHRTAVTTVITRFHDASSHIQELVAAMDKIGLPETAGGWVARRELRAADVAFANNTLVAAIRIRKAR